MRSGDQNVFHSDLVISCEPAPQVIRLQRKSRGLSLQGLQRSTLIFAADDGNVVVGGRAAILGVLEWIPKSCPAL